MKNLSGDSRIALGILLLLVVVTIFAALQREPSNISCAISASPRRNVTGAEAGTRNEIQVHEQYLQIYPSQNAPFS